MATKLRRGYFFKQIFQLLLALACAAAATALFNTLRNDVESIVAHQIELLSRSVSSMAALNLENALKEDNQEQLTSLINVINSEYYIFDATIYNAIGEVVVSSDLNLPLEDMLAIEGAAQTPITGLGRSQYVAEIREDNGDNMGFLRITVETQLLESEATALIDRDQQLLYLIVGLAVIVGFLLTRTLSLKRRWGSISRQEAKQTQSGQASQFVNALASRSKNTDTNEEAP
ncbi:hypothetical protein DBZ36_15235 [Alginatibacterium sediminis]|uniref:Smp protein n=1 Tax=Alginatibacterium sediminis TaxID=2164068 RepID=A0A420E8K7_9ALTE|nr:AhpA/YtjB family protein [Alginatibacterium sediminis]RKF15731.1 hypothetical protein DBZ36_15235 [Alginatibacterium sediminis]